MSMDTFSLPIIRIEENPGRSRSVSQTSEMFYVLSGAITLTVEDIAYPVHENELFYISSGLPFVLDSGTDSILCRVSFSPGNDNDILTGSCFFVRRSDRYGQACISSFLDMVMHYRVVRQFDDYCLSCLYQMLYAARTYVQTIGNPLRTGTAYTSSGPLPSDERARLLREYIEENYAAPLTQAQTARSLNISASYLARYFKKAFNTTFTDYLNGVRLAHVASDLAATDKSITEIALSHGFSNISTFNSAFRRTYRISPSDYRKSAREGSDHTEELLRHSLSGAQQAEQDTGTIRLDIRTRKQFRLPWRRLVNAGRLADLGDYQIRNELLEIAKDRRAEMVRVWNVISPENGLGKYISDDVSDYSLDPIDRNLDFLIENGLTPYLDLSYNYEHQGFLGISVVALEGFAGIEEAVLVFGVLLRHLIARYGEKEVSRWIFGLWLPGQDDVYSFVPEFLKDDGYYEYVKQQYFLIRKLLPEARIGLAQFGHLYKSGSIREELAWFNRNGIRPDLVTFTSFPYVLSEPPAENLFTWTPAPHFIRMELSNLKVLLREAGWDNIPVWLISFNFSTWMSNTLNDSRFRGAYLLSSMADIYDQTDIAAILMLSDAALAAPAAGQILGGRSGLISYSGIKKPAYHAFEFLQKVRSGIAARGVNYLLSADDDGCQLLVFNTKELGLQAFMVPEKDLVPEKIPSYFKDLDELHFTAVLYGFRPGRYRIRQQTVSAEHGDIQSWLIRNRISSGLTASEIRYLKAACLPSLELSEASVDEAGMISISCDLAANDFCCIEIEEC